jgi:hypothetical protein
MPTMSATRRHLEPHGAPVATTTTRLWLGSS